MAVETEKYIPLLVSERIEPNDVGQYDLCRAAVLAMLLNGGTNGEWMTNPNGSRWGRAKIKKLLERMRKRTREVLRGSFNQGHVYEFLEGAGWSTSAWEEANVAWKDIVAGLKTDKWGYSLSGDVKHTPAGSPLRKYVNPNVGHNIALIRISGDGKRIGFIDPMTPHGTKKYLRWAPKSHFQMFASEFAKGGKVVAGRVRKGFYTSANKVRRNRAKVVLKLQTELLALQDLRQEQESELIVQDKKIKELLAALRVCEGEEDNSEVTDLEDEIAILESQLDKIKDILSE